MRIIKNALLLFLSFFVSAGSCDAQENQLNANYTHYSVKDGLASNAISNIARDCYGYIWIATWNGLSRFDGLHFRNYVTGPASGTPFLHNRILDIYPDCYGNIWMRMYDNRVFVLNYHTDRIQSAFEGINGAQNKKSLRRLSLSPDGKYIYAMITGEGIYQLSLPHGRLSVRHYSVGKYEVRNIIADSNNQVWIESGQGLLRMELSDGQIYPVPGIEGDVVTAFSLVGKNLYVSRKNGEIDRLAIGDLTKYYVPARLHTQTQIKTVTADSKGRIWYTTSAPGVSMYNPMTGQNSNYTQKVNTPENDVHGATILEMNGRIWVRLFHGGFGYYDEKTNRIEYFHNNPDNPWNLSNTVLCFTVLPENVLFMSTSRRGLDMIELYNNRIEHFTVVGEEGIYGANETRAIIWSKRKHAILIGNKLGDVYCNGQLLLSTHGRIYGLMEDDKGRLWISDKDKGLLMYDYSTGKLSATPVTANAYQTLEFDGMIFVANYSSGVQLINKGKVQQVYTQRTDMFQKARTLCRVSRNELWAGTTDGILVIRRNGNSFKATPLHQTLRPDYQLASNDIIQIKTDSHGGIWIATNGGGLANVVYQDSLGNPLSASHDEVCFRTFTEADGLPSNEIRALTFDKKGNLWFSADQNICSYDLKRDFITSYSIQDGLGDVTCSECGAMTLPDGRMLFGTMNGYYMVDEKRLLVASSSQYRLAITDVIVNDILASPRKNDFYDYNVIDSGIVNLPSRSSIFSIRFASLNYQVQHSVHYQYMLEGYDRQWHNADRTLTASYADVPAGTYRFRVRAFQQERPDKFEEKQITVVVPPYFLLRPMFLWMYLFAGCIVFVVVFVFYRRSSNHKLSAMHVLKVSPDEVAYEDKEDYDFVSKQLAWLEEHYSEQDLRIESMARVAGMSRTGYYNKLKELTNMSPKEFVTDFRIKKACMYLLHEDHTIGEIAMLTGFNEPFYFARIFKKKMGMTPSQYRVLHKNDAEKNNNNKV